jgi:hypothetical protein
VVVPVSHQDVQQSDRFVASSRLSTDYLNRYAEALMLIEMAALDSDILSELKAWKPIGYLEHFEASKLRSAPDASEAYLALDPVARRAFEALCSAKDRLVETVILTLDEAGDAASHGAVIEIAAEAFRNLFSRANAFINSDGDMETAAYDKIELQAAIDRIIAL